MKFSLQTFLKKITSISFSHGGVASSPLRDWGRMLTIFLVLLIVAILWSTYLFWQIRNGELFVDELTSPSEIQVLDRSVLREVLLYIDEKDSRYDTLLEDSPTFPHPLR